ncbi:MAG: eukaryotic porin/Tom40 [Piptocephalis tieghemiana]|nr:MAG: eukaryotic porin/Tom40 [Piptocephalis tieghemiana]
MSVPPAYSDIGKASNDLLFKDFPTGQVKLEVNTVTPTGVKFTVLGHQDNKNGHVFGELKTKFTDKANGLTLTQGWSAANVLSTKVELANKVASGLKLELNGSFLPDSGKRNAKVATEYKQPGLFSRANVDLFKGPTFTGDVSFGLQRNLVLGGEVSYDVVSGKVTKYAAAAGFIEKDYVFSVHAHSSLSVFTGSYYHRVSPQVEVGGKVNWDSKVPGGPVGIDVGTKYKLDADASVKARIDNFGKLSLAYSQLLRPGVKLNLAGTFDTSKLQENAHKVGLSLVFEN